MIRASDYLGVVKGKYDYLFFLVTDIYWLESAGAKSLKHVLEETFARRLGTRGAVVTSFSENVEHNYQMVLEKRWQPEVKDALSNPRDPKLLVIGEDFEGFDPSRHRYVLIDFGEYRGDSEAFIGILREMESIILSGRDLFEWWEHRASVSISFVDRLREASELKPGVWGFSFDLKKFFKWT